MPEKESSMGNRGSKSASKFSTYVCIHININNVITSCKRATNRRWLYRENILRFVLKGFERNHQIKILSYQINKVRWYTSITSHKPTNTPQSIHNP